MNGPPLVSYLAMKSCPSGDKRFSSFVRLVSVLLHACSTLAFETWKEEPKTCPPACSKRGNCNLENGRCMCQFGYIGDVCEHGILDACRSGPLGPPTCQLSAYPRNCACYRQCHRVHCNNTLGICDDETAFNYNMGGRLCYHYNKEHAYHRLSVFPNETDQTVEWRAFQNEENRQIWKTIPYSDIATIDRPYRDLTPLPLHECPDNCHFNGGCLKNPTGQKYCMCFKGFLPTTLCKERDQGACLNNCTHRGECIQGFCHCKHGYWGIDCSRSKAYAPLPFQVAMLRNLTNTTSQGRPYGKMQQLTPVRSRLRIYVYELPWHVSFPLERDGTGGHSHDGIYLAYMIFLKTLLLDWSVRTENPYEANLFYIPLFNMYYAGNTQGGQVHMFLTLQYVQQNFPFFNKTAGRDHVVFLPTDVGSCDVLDSELVRAPIRIQHLGFLGSRKQWENRDRSADGAPCVLAEKDVVAPPFVKLVLPKEQADVHEKVLAGQPPRLVRNITLFFAGGFMMQDGQYSGGARQALYRLHVKLKETKDPRMAHLTIFSGAIEKYIQALMSSKFCVAPYGNGWGIRIGQAILHGCVPVIIQDWVLQPLESVLPYHKFSVRVSSWEVEERLMDILEAISDQQLRDMQREMAKVQRAFMWESEFGGLAYNYTLEALHASLTNMWTRN